jgi:hypothetical protein
MSNIDKNTIKQWREELLEDFEHLNVMPDVLDTILRCYTTDPEEFEKTIAALRVEDEAKEKAGEPIVVHKPIEPTEITRIPAEELSSVNVSETSEAYGEPQHSTPEAV